MSGSSNRLDAIDDSLHETADRIVRDLLDNNIPSHVSISPSGELYRAIERFHETRRRAESLLDNTEIPGLRQMASEQQDMERRRRLLQESSPMFVPNQPRGSSPTTRERSIVRPITSSSRRGRRPLLSRQQHQTARARILENERLEASSPGFADLRQAGRQLEAASSSLRALLDDPVPDIPSPSLLTLHDYSGDAEYSRRAKRRKLDTDKLDSGFTGFSYGKYGQVEPGKLQMEIVSCDGGIYQEFGGDYCAENVLRGDDSVYCTKSNRCNLVLRHQGATVFSLKELVIKAPHSGYTAPIQEGMVFISMTSDDLLTRTAQYQIQYSPPRRNPSSEPPPIVSIRHNEDGSLTAAQARARQLYNIGLQDDECDYRTAQIPPEFTTNAPPFQVTTEFSDSEDEESNHPPNSRRRPPAAGFADDLLRDSSGDEDTRSSGVWPEDYLLGMNRSPRQRRRETERRRETASQITLTDAADASQLATQEAVRAVGGKLMAPHARFFIERDKSKCTLRFDPPVSGRFILLKMWSPHHSPTGNIDIQSVSAMGFAGPRFFPAVSLR